MLEKIRSFTRKSATFVMNSPFRRVTNWFGLRNKVTESAYIDLVNKNNELSFYNIPVKRRTFFLPHCLRNQKCPAKLGDYGYECALCGKCSIATLKKKAEKIGYKVFVVPGGSVIEKIILKFKPDAVFGVACSKELVQGIEMCESNKIPVQTVTLIKDGCVNTIVDEDEVIDKLGKNV